MTAPLVRSADIAAMADVSRAAVTQWRKRHTDFPRPVEGSDPDSPLFDRREVERWLIARGRFPQRSDRHTDPAVVAGLLLDHLRGVEQEDGPALAGAALVAEYLTRTFGHEHELRGAAQPLTQSESPTSAPPTTLVGLDPADASPWLRFLASASPEVAQALEPIVDADATTTSNLLPSLCSTVADIAVDKFLDVYDIVLRSDRRRGESLDPQPMSVLLADLVDVAGVEKGDTVLDPAMGVASTLLTIGGRHSDIELVGIDIVRSTYATALRRAILANRRVNFRLGNSLGADPASGISARVVVSVPPWGLRDFGPDVDVHDPRWLFGRPSPRSDGIWLQQAIIHLADGGRGFVVTTRSELSRSGPTAALRQELLRQGTVEAIIQLPAVSFTPFASVETAIWVLARPGQTVDPDRVLLINLTSERRPDASTLAAAFRRAVNEYERWHTTGDAADTPSSMIVSVRQLLEPGVGLEPDIWLRQRDAPGPQELINRIQAARSRLEETSVSARISLPDFAPAGTVRREKLTDLPGVTVIRGIPDIRLREAEAASGAPVLTGRILHQHFVSGTAEPERHVDPRNLPDGVATRPGDIAVSTVTRIGGSPAKRIDLDGWVPSSTVFLVRVDPGVPGAPDPDYLMNCINATTDSHHPRMRDHVRILPSHIDIPVLAATEQHQIAALVRNLADAAAAAEKHVAQLRDLITLIEAASGTGTLTVKT